MFIILLLITSQFFEGLHSLTFKIKKIFEAEAIINDLLLEPTVTRDMALLLK